MVYDETEMKNQCLREEFSERGMRVTLQRLSVMKF